MIRGTLVAVEDGRIVRIGVPDKGLFRIGVLDDGRKRIQYNGNKVPLERFEEQNEGRDIRELGEDVPVVKGVGIAVSTILDSRTASPKRTAEEVPGGPRAKTAKADAPKRPGEDVESDAPKIRATDAPTTTLEDDEQAAPAPSTSKRSAETDPEEAKSSKIRMTDDADTAIQDEQVEITEAEDQVVAENVGEGAPSEQPQTLNNPDPALVMTEPAGAPEPTSKTDRQNNVPDAERIAGEETAIISNLNMMEMIQKAQFEDKDYNGALATGEKMTELARQLEGVRKRVRTEGAPESDVVGVENEMKEAPAIAQQTQAKVEAAQAEKESATNKLAGGALDGEVPAADGKTGADNDVAMEHTMDRDEVAKSKPSAEAKDDVVRADTSQVDKQNPASTSNEQQVTLGADANAMDVVNENDDTNVATTSANAMAAAEDASMEDIPALMAAATEQQQRESDRQPQPAMDTSDPLRDQERRERRENISSQAAKLARQRTQREQNEARIAKAIENDFKTGGQFGGFEQLMDNLQATFPEEFATLMGEQGGDDEARARLSVRKMVMARLFARAKSVDVQKARQLSARETILGAVDEIATRTVDSEIEPGQSPFGAPIFAPDKSRSDLHSLQSRVVGTITATEQKALREELRPLWNEFRTVRTTAGVQEMEAMPTAVITNPRSSIKAASKPREDVDQRTEGFGNFMFWLLHHKWALQEPATWSRFFLYSAALGYNDLTIAQINWLITGNANGDLTDQVDFKTAFEQGEAGKEIELAPGVFIQDGTIRSLVAQAEPVLEPQNLFPGRNTSPSAAPVDNSRHPDGSTAAERQTRQTFSGIPSRVTNIPDPRFSQRGGINIPNVRVRTIRNPNFRPPARGETPKKPGEPGFEPEFITEEVPDIGAGSKDIQAMIEQTEADQLISQQHFNLYAPIHPQACDRYLGARNYQRLSQDLEFYLSNYAQQGFAVDDVQGMYSWNQFTMAVYGGMLYAFVTDIAMQRSTPVFDPATPDMVGQEFMELNELIGELKRYQQHADDRADRVMDSMADRKPLEKHLDNFFKDERELDRQRLADANAVIVALPDQPIPTGEGGTTTGGDGGEDAPLQPPVPGPSGGGGGEDPLSLIANPVQPNLDKAASLEFHGGQHDTTQVPVRQSAPSLLYRTKELVGPLEMDNGIVNNHSSHSAYTQHATISREIQANMNKRKVGGVSNHIHESSEDMTKRQKMFLGFMRR